MSNATEDLKKRLAAASAQKGKDFPAMLEAYKGEIARALPRHLNPDRLCRIALTAFRRTKKLEECDPRSVFAAVIQASQLGLEPDTLGRAYLIPYGRECQFIPGWKGLVELMHRSGQGSIWTGAVYVGDEFDFALGDSPRVNHVPSGEYGDDKLRYVYAVGRPKGCEWPIIEIWTMARVKAHRDRFNKVGRKHYSFENMEMYARKVVLLQVLKYMPLSADLVTSMELDNASESGQSQGLTIEGVLDGEWTPPAPVEEVKPEEGPPIPTPGQPPRSHGNTAEKADASHTPTPAPGHAPPASTRKRVEPPAGMELE
ncbi:recombination protein RecT [soil metagenome]